MQILAIMQFFSNYFHKVYSFEAHPEIFEILRFNTRNNKNINVFNIALFNKIEKMFIISDQIANYGASHISKNFCPQSQQNAFELETKVFSDIFPNLNIKKKISFIKLDVEESSKKYYKVLKIFYLLTHL